MAKIKHRHRLEGLDGQIDPQRSDWRADKEHLVVWRAEGLHDGEGAAARLRRARNEATLEYLAASGKADEVVEKDTVEITEVTLEGSTLTATLRLVGRQS